MLTCPNCFCLVCNVLVENCPGWLDHCNVRDTAEGLDLREAAQSSAAAAAATAAREAGQQREAAEAGAFTLVHFSAQPEPFLTQNTP